MPLIRRLPKRGFTPRIPAVYQVVNLESLNAFDRDAIVEPKDLFNAGIINKRRLPVKILGGGELRHALTVRANAFSRQAEEKIKQANGRAERIERQ
jgi:large subunit ribosomal protein L15